MKLALLWLVGAAGFAAISWFYHPSIELAVISTGVATFLMLVVSWSASRLRTGAKAGLKTLLVGVVAGFMYTQALDIAYSVYAAPAGLRLQVLLEAAAVGVLLSAVALVAVLFWPKNKKQGDSNSPEG